MKRSDSAHGATAAPLTWSGTIRRIAPPFVHSPPVAHPAAPLHAADCLAVIPARDEAATVATVVAGVREALGCTVLVVDDASRDDTVAVARSAGARVLKLPLGLGAWGATQAGIRYARRNGFAGVITLDADGQHCPESLPALFAAQAGSGANVVIGTCVERLSRAKRIAWLYLRALTGLGLRDFTSGLRLYDRHAVDVLAGPAASLLDYQDVGVLMLLAKNGLAIEETPVPMLPRREGHSRVFASWPVVARYMLHTTVLCMAQLDAGRRHAHTVAESRAA
jgi:glycosyltransferase involved in cell wall biosynthesis